jgi:hypothetical protein
VAWIEVHQSLPMHPKTIEAAMLLEVPEAEVVGHMVCLWIWAVDARPDGVLDLSKPRIIARAAGWEKEPGRFVDALIAVRFLDEDGAIHDWDDYTGRLMERRERVQVQTRQRVQAFRERRRLSSIEGQEVTQGVTRYGNARNASVTLGNAPTVPNRTQQNRTQPTSTTSVERGPAREADASAPLSKTRGSVKVAAVIDALRAEGMTGTLTGRDRKAVNETPHDPQEVAALYAAIYRGEYGDHWMHTKLSVALCLEYLPGWRSHQAGHQAPARSNGQPPRAPSGAAAVRSLFRKAKDDAAARAGGGRGGDGVGAGEAGPGVPRLLRD